MIDKKILNNGLIINGDIELKQYFKEKYKANNYKVIMIDDNPRIEISYWWFSQIELARHLDTLRSLTNDYNKFRNFMRKNDFFNVKYKRHNDYVLCGYDERLIQALYEFLKHTKRKIVVYDNMINNIIFLLY